MAIRKLLPLKAHRVYRLERPRRRAGVLRRLLRRLQLHWPAERQPWARRLARSILT